MTPEEIKLEIALEKRKAENDKLRAKVMGNPITNTLYKTNVKMEKIKKFLEGLQNNPSFQGHLPTEYIKLKNLLKEDK